MGRGSGTGQRSSLHASSHSKRPLNSSDYDEMDVSGSQATKVDSFDSSFIPSSCSDAVHCDTAINNPLTMDTSSVFANNSAGNDALSSLNMKMNMNMNMASHHTTNNTSAGEEEAAENAPLWHLITTYLGYLILIVTGHVRDFFLYRIYPKQFRHLQVQDGLAPINSGFGTFSTLHKAAALKKRYLYYLLYGSRNSVLAKIGLHSSQQLHPRIRDVFNRPVTGVPGRTINILERTSNDYNHTFEYSGKTREVLNLSSYNYLGFGESTGPCSDAVELSLKKNGISTASPRMESGTLDIHHEAESLVARFMGQEAALICSMGFATNSTCIPALIGKGGLIISDELNHSSIVFGTRLTGAAVKVFKHNNPADLEAVLRDSISQGQPRTHRPWKKILIVVEGLYSMEGNICRLSEFVELKKKYKAYLYLDEAHSVGAMGPNGRGICDYYGIHPSEIDILMGTFTKSFGAAGGYIAGSKTLIDTLRLSSHSSIYAEPVSIPVLRQIHASMRMIMGDGEYALKGEGRHRIQTLARNSAFFANRLRQLGFIVYGRDAPVVPMLLMNPAKIPAFSREMLRRGIAVVVVGYPATPIITSRVRFCISASHTLDDLEWALGQISEVGDMLLLKMNK